jgi:RHH-type proline utilization regulon transcriptional repressor/proline dehydrogenase/delta 1-pyrroline-5-carboxylate dehydrogenase
LEDVLASLLLGTERSLRGRIVSRAVPWGVGWMARRFIAGSSAREAERTILALRRRRMAFSLDLLGEKVLSEREADAYAQSYVNLIDSLSAGAASWPADDLLDRAATWHGRPAHVYGGHMTGVPPSLQTNRALPRVNLSIKLTALYSQFDPVAPRRSADGVLARLRAIARLARKKGVFLHVDMEHREVKDLSFDIFARLAAEPEFADWRDLGIVLQAYLRDSGADLDRLLELARRRGTPFTVRLVKGAYWDQENIVAAQRGWPVPVFTDKRDTDANFELLARRMLAAADALDGAYASHNVRSLAHVLAAEEAMGLAPGGVEFQLLYGMGEAIQSALVEGGRRVRVYAPFGEIIPGMAYLIRRLMENTANVSFLRQGFIEMAAAEELLADPAGQRSMGVSPMCSTGILPVCTTGVPPVIASYVSPSSSCVSPSGSLLVPNTGDASPAIADAPSTTGETPGVHTAGTPVLQTPMRPSPRFTNCPDTDFSMEDSRMKMRDAIERVRSQLGREYRLVIGGREQTGVSVAARENPARPSQTVARVHWGDRAAADAAAQAARDAQPAWGSLPATERAKCLARLAELIEGNRHTLAAWEVFETAKGWREADADVSEAVDYCRFYALEAIDKMDRPRRSDVPGESNLHRYLSRGVGAVIAPWNFPLAILAGMSTAALAAGNAVILKPAEQSSAVAGEFMVLVAEAGFPPGVVNYLPGAGEVVGDCLVRHEGIDFVAFTGSRQVGLSIYAAAAATPGRGGPKHVVCEMGGKNAILVDADADLDEAAGGVIASAFGYAGQKCSACSRVIVVGEAHGRFLDRLVEATRSLALGPPEEGEGFLGPLIDAAAAEKVRGYIEIGRREARCALETDVSPLGEGHWVGPTIFADVPPSARIAQEEIFGPVLAVLRTGNLDEALAIANGTAFALTGGLYSRSPGSIERAQREFRVGNLYINRKITGALVARQPFGGFGYSGLGSKAGGSDYLLQFLLPQTVTENTTRHGFVASM